MAGPLNLSDADLSGFEPVDAGRYNAEIVEINWDTVKNLDGRGKMPAGTPMLKIRFKIVDDGPAHNRNVWVTYVNPPADYDPSKAAKMRGMIARFFIACGDTEETVRSESFDPDFDDYKDKEVVVVVGKEPKRDREGNLIDGEFNNPVKGVKPAGSIATATATGSDLL
jgi:hypothetical protein